MPCTQFFVNMKHISDEGLITMHLRERERIEREEEYMKLPQKNDPQDY